MKRNKFSVEHIVSILKQANLGLPVAELIRQVWILEQTFYRWKRQYAGLDSDQVREFKQLAEENGRLKKLVAELSLDKAVLQDGLAIKFQARAHETGCCLPDGVARLAGSCSPGATIRSRTSRHGAFPDTPVFAHIGIVVRSNFSASHHVAWCRRCLALEISPAELLLWIFLGHAKGE